MQNIWNDDLDCITFDSSNEPNMTTQKGTHHLINYRQIVNRQAIAYYRGTKLRGDELVSDIQANWPSQTGALMAKIIKSVEK